MSRLLLIEDDTMIGEVLTSSLRARGHQVLWDRAGRGGLEVAGSTAARPPEIVTLRGYGYRLELEEAETRR